MKHIFFLVLTTMAVLGCKTPEKPQDLSLFCYVRYDAASKAVKAEATLQEATKKTALEIPGGIRYQSMEMVLAPVYGLKYRYDYNASFLTEHVFEWRDKQNAKQAFKIRFQPIDSFSLTGSTLKNTAATSLQWEGTALGKGETLVLMWENAEKGLTLPMEVTSTSGMPLIDIPAGKLKSLEPGNWTLSLVRKKLVKETINTLPASCILEYYTKAIPIKITA
jgi:hypothetical protein